MEHEPFGFLGNANILGKPSACDTLFVRSDKLNCYHPLAKVDFAVLKDRADLDRKPFTAIVAFVGALVRKVIDLGAFADGVKWRSACHPEHEKKLPTAIFMNPLPRSTGEVLRSVLGHAPNIGWESKPMRRS